MFDICLINEPINENYEQIFHIPCGGTWYIGNYSGEMLQSLNIYLTPYGMIKC